MVRNEQEATRFDALYMPPVTLAGTNGMADASVEQGVTKVNGAAGRLGQSSVRSLFPDNKGRVFLCPSVTYFVSFSVGDRAHPLWDALVAAATGKILTRNGCVRTAIP